MIVSLIVAIDKNRGIGKDNQLPWHLPEDLKNFKRITTGHHLLLGRKTYESIGRPLPKRTMLVLTSNPRDNQESVFYFNEIHKAIEFAQNAGESEIYIIGGPKIYEQTLGLADRLYLTEVDTNVDADAFFPKFNKDQWESLEETQFPVADNNPYPWTFSILKKLT